MRKIIGLILMLFTALYGFSEVSTKIFFVKLDHESYGFGDVPYYVDCQRIIEGKNTLEETVNILIKGLTEREEKQEFYNFIPRDTKLLSATIKNSIAILNFSEELTDYSEEYGLLAYDLRLGQIIYTVTQLPTVKSVQFLINGKKKDYLSEGVWIGTPLTRDSF